MPATETHPACPKMGSGIFTIMKAVVLKKKEEKVKVKNFYYSRINILGTAYFSNVSLLDKNNTNSIWTTT